MSAYVIVSGGPSVAALDVQVLAEKHGMPWRVAVNRAWYLAPELFHVWSAGESPGRMWATVAGQKRGLLSTLFTQALVAKHRPVIWCPEHYAAEWANLGAEVGVSLPIVARDAAMRTDPGWPTDASYIDGSLTQTLAWAFRAGATEIHVYGADLTGADGYGVERPAVPVAGSTVEGLVVYSPEWWARRWANERKALDTAVREAGEHGIAVVVHKPPSAELRFMDAFTGWLRGRR